MKAGILKAELRESVVARLKNTIENAVETAFAEPEPEANPGNELSDVFVPVPQSINTEPSAAVTTKRFIDSISDALAVGLERHPDLVIMGQDVADYGGVFKVTDGLAARFGKKRIRNTPICESVVVGAGLGLSIAGMKSVVEMQFADFVSCGFNQIVNNLAKSQYRWGQNADVVVRMPTGAGTGAGPFHSQSNEAWFTHVAGLKVVYPSTPEDAKGLLLASIADPNPVLFFEHKQLYRSISGLVPEGYYDVPIGIAKLVRHGSRMAIITYGAGVHWAIEEAAKYSEGDIAVLDLRTLAPLDWDSISEVVKETGRVLILHEDTLTGGIGGEIAAYIAEHLFVYLDAPIMRVASLDTPVPFSTVLEQSFLAKSRLSAAVSRLLEN